MSWRSVHSARRPTVAGGSENHLPRPTCWSAWLDLALVAGATLLAAALRYYQLDTIPPGFYHDEAINGLAGIDIREGRLFLLYGFDVREPLFHWLVASAQLLWGNTVVSVRSASALAGTLTVPALYLLAARLFDRRIAACAAFGLALSFWHLELSRFGVRGVTLPLLTVVTSYCLWQGLQGTVRRRPFILAGAFLGLTGYTYISSRAVPLLLAAFAAWQAIFARATLRAVARAYVLGLLVAAIIFAPLGYTFLANPDLFSARSGGVSLLAAPDAPGAIVESAIRTLGMFVVAGDPNLRHNLDGRPVFDPAGAMFFLLGLATALRRWRQPAYTFCLLWLLTMLLPGVLSADSPHFIRTGGAAPAAYMLMGIGVISLSGIFRSWLAPRWYWSGIALWFVALVLLTYRAYFVEWARRPAVAAAFEATLSEPARYLSQAPPGSALVLFPDGYPTEYPQAFQYLGGRAWQRLTWYDGNNTMMVPKEPPVAPANTIFLVLGANPSAERLVSGMPGVHRLARRDGDDGGPLFRAYQATAMELWQDGDEQRLGVILGGQALLEGYRLPEDGQGQPLGAPWQTTVAPGGKLLMRLRWRPLRPAEQSDLRLFFHLVDTKGQRWSGKDLTAYPSSAWRGGERLLTWVEVPVPEQALPGKYELRVGAYSYADRKPLPVTDEHGSDLGESAVLATLKVPPRPVGVMPANQLEAGLASGPKLLGYELWRQQRALHVALFWQATGRMAADYTVFLHVSDAAERPLAQHDGPPAAGTFPTSYWETGDVVRDEHVVPLDPALPPGNYFLRTGMYDPQTGRRLPSLAGGDAISLQAIALP